MDRVKNQKLLIIHTRKGFQGGIERYLYDTATLLKEAGYILYGCFIEDRGDQFDHLFEEIELYRPGKSELFFQKLKKDGVSVAMIHKIASILLLKELQQRFQTIAVMHDHSYYCPRSHKYGLITHKNCDQPMSLLRCSGCSLLLERKDGKIQSLNIRKRLKLWEMIKKINRFVVLSDFMGEQLMLNGIEQSRISKIYPVVNISDEKNGGSDPQALLFVGQLIRGKGVDLLLHVVSNIHINFHLTIVGSGNGEKQVQKLIQELKLDQKITVTGWVDSIEPYYRKGSIIIIPSRWQEPFGLVGVEAFSYQTPVIAFDIGGISEWLRDGINGFLIPPFDLNLMGSRIRQLLRDSDLRNRMGRDGFEMIQKDYSKGAFLKQFQKLLRGLS